MFLSKTHSDTVFFPELRTFFWGKLDIAFRQRLSNIVLVSEPKCGGRGCGCGVLANEYNSAHRALINFGDLTPYLTYGFHIVIYVPRVKPRGETEHSFSES
jgi:hypothetical protein